MILLLAIPPMLAVVLCVFIKTRDREMRRLTRQEFGCSRCRFGPETTVAQCRACRWREL